MQPTIEPAVRELPYNKEAEQAVIGSILSNAAESAGDAVEILHSDDFYFVAHRMIFGAIIELFNDNTPIDFVTVSNKLAQKDELEAAGGVNYLRDVALGVPTTRHIAYYSNIIRDCSLMRKLIECSSEIANKAYDSSDSPDRVLEQAEQLIFKVASAKETRDILRINDVLYESYQMIVENSQNNSGITGLDTGYWDLNKRCGGFHGGELILIAGRPGMGKSSFAVNIAEYVSITKNQPVAIFNLEMPKEQIVNRILCSQARVDSSKIRNGTLDPDDWLKISETLHKIEVAPIFIDDTPTITVSQIRAKCRRIKHKYGLSMIVIDYLQLMQAGSKFDNRQNEIAEISRSLKILSKELDVPVIALSQLSRASESRSDKRPMLSDLRESGAIEQDADMVMFLYRESYYSPECDNPHIAECIIAKNRNGETGTFSLGWTGEYTKFANVLYDEEGKAHAQES